MEVDVNQKYLVTTYEEYTNSYVEKDLVIDRTMVDFRLKNWQQPEVRAPNLSATTLVEIGRRMVATRKSENQ